MLNWKPLLALSTLAWLTACAGPGPGPWRGGMGTATNAGMERHMQDMQAEMGGARTPEEQQAIMLRHMQAMHPGVVQPGMPMSQQAMMDLCLQHMQTMHPGVVQPGTQDMPRMQGGMPPPAR